MMVKDTLIVGPDNQKNWKISAGIVTGMHP